MRDPDAYLTDRLGDYAVRFIEAQKENPFLVYLPFNAVHGPFQATRAQVEAVRDEPDPKRRLVKAMLASMDANVGKVLEALRRNGLEENTIVIFLSDNGGHEASPNKPLRGKKATYWEGGLRVPFCVQWKGTVAKGTKVTHPVISLDVLPTLVEAAGGTVDAAWNLDGKSLLPLIRGETTRAPHDALYWVWGARKAIRRGPLKALSHDGGKSWQLYNLVQDIGEADDLADKRPRLLQDLVAQHGKWEGTLIPQQWGWNKALGVKDPLFGKPRPYHAPGYFDASKKEPAQ